MRRFFLPAAPQMPLPAAPKRRADKRFIFPSRRLAKSRFGDYIIIHFSGIDCSY